ncbi:MAG: PrsW family intramembrane metalloprotease [Microbacterium sp.]
MSLGADPTSSSQNAYRVSLDPRERLGAQPVPSSPVTHATIPPMPKTARAGRSTWFWVWGVLAVLLIFIVAYFISALGAAASIIGLIVALIPFTIVVSVLLWVDRWEPEPMGLVVFALAWGAIPAIAIALLGDLLWQGSVGDSAAANIAGGVIRAPIVEEFAKSLGIVLLLVMGRRAFDGPVDGIVYGALIGAGFAFTENIQYFAISVIEGGASSLTWTFVMRGLLSPFAHAMFTGVTGYMIGVAVRNGRGTFGRWGIGLLGAVGLHALWNGAATFTTSDGWLHFYVVLQVPLFILFIIFTMRLRREEERLTAVRLGDYAAAGWFTAQEVAMLATPQGRKQGMAWAKSLPGDRGGLMKDFIKDSTALAATRQRILSGRDAKAPGDERVLLERTARTRQALLSY